MQKKKSIRVFNSSTPAHGFGAPNFHNLTSQALVNLNQTNITSTISQQVIQLIEKQIKTKSIHPKKLAHSELDHHLNHYVEQYDRVFIHRKINLVRLRPTLKLLFR